MWVLKLSLSRNINQKILCNPSDPAQSRLQTQFETFCSVNVQKNHCNDLKKKKKRSTIWSCWSLQNGFIRHGATDSSNRYNFCLWHLWYGCLSTNGAFITFVSQCRLFSWQSSVTVLDSLLESGHWGLRVWHKRAIALCVNGHINLAFNEHWWLSGRIFFFFFMNPWAHTKACV